MHIEKYTYMVLKAEPVRFIPHCSIAELVLTYTGWDMNVRSLVPEPMRLIPTLCGLPSRYRASPQTVSPVQHGCSTHIFSWQPAITSASNVTPTSVPFHQNLNSALHSKKVPSTGIFWWLFIGDKMILNIGPLLRNPLYRPSPQNSLPPISKVYLFAPLAEYHEVSLWASVAGAVHVLLTPAGLFISVHAANCHLPSTEDSPPPFAYGLSLAAGACFATQLVRSNWP